jgi:hypothetical protein
LAARFAPASVALGRAPAEVDWPGEPAQLGPAPALRNARIGLFAEAHRLGGRHAARGRAPHDHRPAHRADPDLELVTRSDRRGPRRVGGSRRLWRSSSRLGCRLSLSAYPALAAASSARRAFLNAISPLASWRSARWFSSFFDQLIRIPRLRFSHEWHASRTHRRARQPVTIALSVISSPRARICAVSRWSPSSSWTSRLS